MSLDALDEWISLTHQTSLLLQDRSMDNAEENQALAGRIDVALTLLPTFRASLKGGKNGSQKNCAARIPKEVFENIMHPKEQYRGSGASSIGQLPRATDVFLQRAGSMPIDVIITGQRPALPSQAMAFSSLDEASVGTVLERIDISHVRTLVVADGRARIAPFAKRLNAQPAASLDLLTHVVLEDYSWNISDKDAWYFEEGACGLNAANLETLRLKNCFVDLNCPALTSLDIEYDGRLSPRVGGEKLASALIRCPALKTLRLRNSQSFEVFDTIIQHGWPAPILDITELPELEHLSITGPAHSIEELLWLIWFPPTTVVHLDVCVWPVGVPDIVRQLARCFQEHLSQEFTTMAIDHDVRFGQEVTRIRMWKSASLIELIPAIRFGVAMKDDDLKPHFEITVRDHEAGRWMTVVNCFTRKMMSDLYSGEVVLRWVEVLDRFPNLKVLFPKHHVLRALDASDLGTEHRI
ncbi:hypothetical protein K488DRAFT_72431 [Vararia minispora EC-137]|uniref:Uncharacterized protein n=1 Tax=Vararia minispora EC-137 TaxID=1314806 RepID=A0ACB8QE77_9AGAM|nr:hypothetical protein K488DRAFT_72431 [Vararia minispora EC-137]